VPARLRHMLRWSAGGPGRGWLVFCCHLTGKHCDVGGNYGTLHPTVIGCAKESRSVSTDTWSCQRPRRAEYTGPSKFYGKIGPEPPALGERMPGYRPNAVPTHHRSENQGINMTVAMWQLIACY
jgi:hypothetical protein